MLCVYTIANISLTGSSSRRRALVPESLPSARAKSSTVSCAVRPGDARPASRWAAKSATGKQRRGGRGPPWREHGDRWLPPARTKSFHAHPDALQLRVIPQAFGPQVAAEARLLVAAERHSGVVEVVSVDPHGAG